MNALPPSTVQTNNNSVTNLPLKDFKITELGG